MNGCDAMNYTDKLPEMRAFQKVFYLPQRYPPKKGSMVFILSDSMKTTISVIRDRINFLPGMNYKFYYIPLKYQGKLDTKRYMINDTQKRKQIYTEMSNKTNLTGIQQMTDKENRNCYVDIHRYMKIYEKVSEKYTQPAKKIKLFWVHLNQIITNPLFNNYKEKSILVPIDEKVPFTGDINELIKNPIFLCYYTMMKFPEYCENVNIDFLFYYGKWCLKWNPSHTKTLEKEVRLKAFAIFKQEMTKLLRNVNITPDTIFNDEKTEKEEENLEVKGAIAATVQHFTGGNDDEPITSIDEPSTPKKTERQKSIEKKVNDITDKVIKDQKVKPPVEGEISSKTAKQIAAEEEIEKDKQLIDDIYRELEQNRAPKSAASSKRDELIREKQKEVKVKDMTVEDLRRIKASDINIPTNDVTKSLHSTNKNMDTVRFRNFDKVYNDKVMQKDITSAFMSLNDKSLPLYVLKIDVKDTSDELNYKETWTVTLEDTLRQRHTLTVDIPKFVDGSFMYLGGNKKLILKQNFFIPVVKIDEDTVEIVTNENKMTLTRNGTKTTTSANKLYKLLEKDENAQKYFSKGNAYVLNGEYITNVEYDEFSKMFVKFKTQNCTLFFSQSEAETYMQKNQIKNRTNEEKMFIGVENGKPIYVDYNTQKTDKGDQIIDIIIRNLPEDIQREYLSARAQKRLMYVSVTTMKKAIPIVLLLCFWEGIEQVMEKAGITYRLSASYPRDLTPDEGVLRFADCYMIYKQDLTQELLMNGFRMIDTTSHKLSDYNKQDPYAEYFRKVYGKMSIVNPLYNTYEFTIDPITKEILETLSMPTDIVNLCIYAVKLMGDKRYKKEIDQSISRVRSNEIVAAILYDAIAKNYTTYRNSNGKQKLSIPRDIVIKNLLSLKTVEDHSTLNPVLELERTHTIEQKGWRGINLEDAYTPAKRAYDKSMIGVIGPTTSPDGAVGVQRVLSVEPKITGVRGFTQQTENLNELKDINLFSPGEMLVPLGVTRDDPNRMGHAIKQSKHVVPVKKSSPVLISNGMEERCRYDLSSDFVINAEEDGEVVEYNEKLKIMVCKYKSGKCQAIDMNPKIVKNGGGGFFLSNILVTNLKVGDKFKKNDLLAWHKDFFTNNMNGGRMNIGTLIKVALMSTYNTYEDSSFITKKLSTDAETEMVFNRQVTVGKNANVDYIAKVGDEIKVGDTLIQFDTSYEDSELNKMLKAISTELKEGVLEDSRNDIKAKKSGVIEDIKIYSTVDLEELSPSLQKIVGDYYKQIDQKKKLLEKYDHDGSIVKCGVLFTDSTKKVSPNKYGVIKGQKIEDGVLFEFYIKHAEILEVGSKMAYFTGIKTVIGEILPEGYEPYSEYRPDEEVSSFIASNSILARMTPSIILTVFGNKCIIELKRHLKDIWDKNSGETRRKLMEDLIYKFFTAFDKTKTNTNYYQSLFNPMSDTQFNNYFKQLFEDEDAYLVLNIVDYENTIIIDDIERAAKVLNIPLFENVYMPHITMDKGNIVRTQIPVPVGYVHVKRTQQTVAKKNGISTSIDIRSALTGQVTGADKNGRESDMENIMLVSLGMKETLKELNGPRSDDPVMKREMLSEIAEKGYVTLDELTDDVENKTALNTVNTYLLGMHINSDLVTKGLMVKSTLKKEL